MDDYQVKHQQHQYDNHNIKRQPVCFQIAKNIVLKNSSLINSIQKIRNFYKVFHEKFKFFGYLNLLFK